VGDKVANKKKKEKQKLKPKQDTTKQLPQKNIGKPASR